MILMVFLYASILLFLGLSIRKACQIGKMPFHGRWELYPVPKEKGKGHYGGSYYEEVKWYDKPRDVSLTEEIVDMMKEMLFIKKLFQNQRPFWWLSYSLHLGIYLTFAWFLIMAAALLVPAGSGLAALMDFCVIFLGAAALGLATFGSGALFLKRVFNQSLRIYTTPQEYFNLLFLFVVGFTGLINWAGHPDFANVRETVAAMLTFRPVTADGFYLLHLLLFGAIIIYIPLTKMSHYVGKFFSFHKVLWDNEPYLPGNEVAEKMKQGKKLSPKKSWSGPHYPNGNDR